MGNSGSKKLPVWDSSNEGLPSSDCIAERHLHFLMSWKPFSHARYFDTRYSEKAWLCLPMLDSCNSSYLLYTARHEHLLGRFPFNDGHPGASYDSAPQSEACCISIRTRFFGAFPKASLRDCSTHKSSKDHAQAQSCVLYLRTRPVPQLAAFNLGRIHAEQSK